MGPTKDKRGVRESFAKVTFLFAKDGRLLTKEFWSTIIYIYIIHIYTHICIYIYMYVCMYVYIYICMYVYLCIYIYVCISMYIYTLLFYFLKLIDLFIYAFIWIYACLVQTWPWKVLFCWSWCFFIFVCLQNIDKTTESAGCSSFRMHPWSRPHPNLFIHGAKAYHHLHLHHTS